MKNGKSKYVLMKKVIVHATTAKITMTIRYTHLCHACLVITNAKVKSMVKVAIDQLDFGFGSNVPEDARSFGFHFKIIRRYG